MESHVNNTNGGESNGRETTEENPTRASQPQPSQYQHNGHRSLGQRRLSRFPSGAFADLQTLESSFGSLSVADSRVPQQNPLLEYRSWTNGSSSLQHHETNGGAGDVYGWYMSHLSLNDCDKIDRTRNNGVFLNGNNSQGANVPYSSRNRQRDSNNGNGSWRSNQGFGSHNGNGSWRSNQGFGSNNGNGSWGSNQGFMNNHEPSLPSYGNPRMRSSAELQKRICEGSKETIDMIFEGLISQVCELMVDPDNHHVVKKLMERCSSEQITRIVDVITQHEYQFVSICTDHVGALSVKSLMRFLRSEEQILRIVRAITINLGALAISRSGNALVILQCFKLFRTSHSTRVLLEVIAQNCLQIATDEYGCRMLQQCLDTGCNVVKQRLIQEIIANAFRLCVNSFGNYVVQYLLELGDPNVTVALIRHLLGHYAYLSLNKFASHVVQKFLKVGYIDPSPIVEDLLSDIDTLLLDPFGNYVIQTALLVCKGEMHMILLGHIERNKPLMRCNMYGNKILKRFNL